LGTGLKPVLDPAEAAAVAELFGVADEQVRRDHFISHLLAALARHLPDALVFFGGTALARTHVPDGRLSEDLDLIAVPSRAAVAGRLETALQNAARREFGQLVWRPALTAVRATVPGVLQTPRGLAVRIQLLDPTGYPAWPTERRQLVQRYRDVPAASLTVLTLPAFVASKVVAWCDRNAARDLYDLWALARKGALTDAAAELFAQLGPTGAPPRPWMFAQAPAEADWVTQLAAQTRLTVAAAEALAVVRAAWFTESGDRRTGAASP
jgi:hypothetical protein